MGLTVSGGSPSITNNDIIGNTGYGLYNSSSSQIVVAENNWWGDASGPYHPTINPTGLGDRVSDNIDFVSWLTEPSNPPIDTTPPSTINNLSSYSGAQLGEIRLTWTAPGDDGGDGLASIYIVRRSSSPITSETAWNNASDVTGEPLPATSGTLQSMVVAGMTPGSQYCFAIRAQDDNSNISGISNSPCATVRNENEKSSAYAASSLLTNSALQEMDQI